MSLPPESAGLPKMPIPRLPQKRKDPSNPASIVGKSRVSRACLGCRVRKIKCDGGTPRCSNCNDGASVCEYPSSRRDRLKIATSQNQNMITLLKDLRLQVPEGERTKIDTLLANVVESAADAAIHTPNSLQQLDQADDEERGEANMSAEVGSSADMDLVDEDLLHDEHTRATGFIGKASEIQWLRKLYTNQGNDSYGGPYGPPGVTREAAAERLAALRRLQDLKSLPPMRTSKASYYLDDEILQMDFMVDPSDMPPFDTAERLMQAYMESCHNSFPFLPKKAFTQQFYQYYVALKRGHPHNLSPKWQATLNLVFAIGAVYSHLISAEWRADDRDHLVYYSRAATLGLMDPWWSFHPDLPQMQITGLLSFYYLSIGRMNRAWILIGLSMRLGYALGLHLRNEDPTAGVAKREILSRIWWAHLSFERFLSTTLGRPSRGADKNCSVPLPLPIASSDIEEAIIASRFGDQETMTVHSDNSMLMIEPANSGSYLKNIAQVLEIAHEGLHLYDPTIVSDSWESTQKTIMRVNAELETWVKSLPEGFNFTSGRIELEHRYRREQNTLNLLYHNTKILITRPCLCRIDGRIPNQSATSNSFNRQVAGACVASAQAITDLLPKDPENYVAKLYEVSPWWNVVQSIMQSLSVLLLEASIRVSIPPFDEEAMGNSLKILTRWLRAMRVTNRMAKRAYFLVIKLLKRLVTTVRIDMSDLLREHEEAISTATITAPALDPKKPGHEPQITNYGAALTPTPDHQFSQFQASPSTPSFSAPQDNVPHPSWTDDSVHEFSDLFLNTWGVSGSEYLGLFFTSYDAYNPLPRFDDDDDDLTEGNEQGPRRMSHP